DWAQEAQKRGAGEIVLNCMDQDGVRRGYDLPQLKIFRELLSIPVIASGGAGAFENFSDAFLESKVDGTLAASVFHSGDILIPELKKYLLTKKISIRL